MSVTATIAASPVQDAVFDLLTATTAFVTRIDSRFYTDVPQNTPFPLAWLTFGDPMEDNADTFGQAGAVVHLELHVFSDYEGDDECLDILSDAVTALHHATLTVSGWTVPLIGRQTPTIAVEDFNGRALRHGVARFDVHARKV